MNNKLQQLLQTLIPFIIIGIIIALFIGLLIMFSYALLWGLVIGGILWIVSLIKTILFPTVSKTSKNGRIIEHNNSKKS